MEPPETGWVGGGVGKRAQLTGPLLSDYEVWPRGTENFFDY